jgi:hypothetical protein
MSEENPVVQSTEASALRPLAYHDAVVAYLKSNESEVWNWACSARAREEHAAAVRSELLRQAYRLDEVSHPEVHQAARTAVQRLGMDVPVNLYQGSDGQINASLYFLVGEAHVVFSGPLLDRLASTEIQAILGHELAHYKLWSQDEGVYHAADRILESAAAHPSASTAHAQTARLFRLFTEAYADRGAVIACGSLENAVSALVKSMTGLSNVSGASYLAQAAEVIAHDGSPSTAASHPEAFLRAHALQLWIKNDPQSEPWLEGALCGPLSLEGADLIAQTRLQSLTRRVLGEVFRPGWMRSELSLAHARRFFPDFDGTAAVDPALTQDVLAAPRCAHYLSALLVDAATCDPDAGDAAIARVIELSSSWGLDESLQARILCDLKMPKRQYTKLKHGARVLLEKAEKNHGG